MRGCCRKTVPRAGGKRTSLRCSRPTRGRPLPQGKRARGPGRRARSRFLSDQGGSVRHRQRTRIWRRCACRAVPLSESAQARRNGKDVVRGNTAFAVDLYRQLSRRTGNLFFSPYSISTALAMTYAAARKNTEKEMAKILHFPLDQHETSIRPSPNCAVSFDKVQRAGNVKLYVANSLWPQRGKSFLQEYLSLVAEALRRLDHTGGLQDRRHAGRRTKDDQRVGRGENPEQDSRTCFSCGSPHRVYPAGAHERHLLQRRLGAPVQSEGHGGCSILRHGGEDCQDTDDGTDGGDAVRRGQGLADPRTEVSRRRTLDAGAPAARASTGWGNLKRDSPSKTWSCGDTAWPSRRSLSFSRSSR